MLEKEFEYYVKNQNELLKKYNKHFVVIIGDNVVDSYPTLEQALEQTAKKYKLGTFLIQECTEGDRAYTQTFHTRAVF